jgi:MFS family permease
LKLSSGWFKFLLASRAIRSIALIYMTLAAPLYLNLIGISVPGIGIIYVAVMLLSAALNLFLGMLGDRKGYKKALILAEVLPMLSAFTLWFTGNAPAVVLAVIFGGVGGVAGGIRGVYSPGSTALVASSYPQDDERVRKLGALIKIGAAFSILGAIMLIAQSYLFAIVGAAYAYRLLFLAAAAMMALSLISLMFIKEAKRPKKTTRMMKRASLAYTLKVIASNMANGAGMGLSLPLLPLIIGLAFHVPVQSLGLTVGLVYIPSYAGVALGSYLSGRHSMRNNIVRTASYTRMASGSLMMAMGAVIAAGYFDFWIPVYLLAIVTLLYLLRSVIAGFGSPSVNAVNIKGIDAEDYGTASSIQGVAVGASMSSSGASGFLMDAFLPLPLFLGGALQAVSGVLYGRFFTDRK